MSRLTRDETAEPVSRDQILRRERKQGSIHFPCLADHLQDWPPYPVNPYSCYMCNHTYALSSLLTLLLVLLLKRKIRTHLNLLSIPQLGGENVKTFRLDQRLQIQNLFMAFKRVPRRK